MFSYMSYYLLRAFSFLLAILPYRLTYLLSFPLGTVAYYLAKDLRKSALSNLAISDLNLSRKDVYTTAKASFQNLALTCLEYGRLSLHSGHFKRARCLHIKQSLELKEKYGSLIYLSAHQANWEVPYIELCTRHKGDAAGRPLKNKKLNDWVVSIRQSTGGKIVPIREAMRSAKKALQEGRFFGLVGDQALPESSYSGLFFGKKAYSSSAPALLAYRSNVPLVVATNKRCGLFQQISYSLPIFPDTSKPLKKEVHRMMNEAMKVFEKSIREKPSDWMWQHNRFKRPQPVKLLKPYRYETILIIYPKEPKKLELLLEKSPLFRGLYPDHDITVLFPEAHLNLVNTKKTDKSLSPIEGSDFLTYSSPKSAFINNLPYKLIFDFSSIPKLPRHFKRGSALTVLTLEDIRKKAAKEEVLKNLDEVLLDILSEGDTPCPKTVFSLKASLPLEKAPS